MSHTCQNCGADICAWCRKAKPLAKGVTCAECLPAVEDILESLKALLHRSPQAALTFIAVQRGWQPFID